MRTNHTLGAKSLRLMLGGPALLTALVIASTLPAQPAPKAAPAKPPKAEVKPAATALTPAGDEEEPPWPREVKKGETSYVVHQPQIESWDGVRVKAHAAIAVKLPGSEAPVYGVAWLTARTSIDKEARLVTYDDLEVDKVRFPSVPDKEAAWLEALRKDVAPYTKVIALDRFSAGLEALDAEKSAATLALLHTPPRFVFSTTPAVLVYVDGKPAYRPIEKTKLERVINTRPLVVKDEKGRHFVRLFDGWMEAPALEGPWTVAKKPSKEIAQTTQTFAGQVDMLHGGDPKDPKTWPTLSKAPSPRIVVATAPTELIVTEGEPSFVSLTGTDLLYVKNTTGNIFKLTSDQKTYVLAAGRWFRAASNDGPWEHVANDKLPADFAKIPDESPKENVKASVAGTAQAQEALIANQIPQTANVKRSEAKLQPKIDGEVKLAPIEGTELQYVANSPTPIVRVSETSYYAVDNGVWFASGTAAGPWAIATSVPSVIYSIPASSPVHYVTYVKIYESTPDVVRVGYTPGYYGACVSSGAVVYGTGYPYTPWVGSTWYGAPVTYGMGSGMSYTPWTGWTFGFGFGWSWGAATVGWGWGAYPWYGPAGWGAYYPPYGGYYGGWGSGYYGGWGGAAYRPGGGAAAWGPGGWAATSGNVYNRWGANTAVSRNSGGYNAWTGNSWSRQAGSSYNSRTGTLSSGQRSSVANVYSGNYASGARGSAVNPRTGSSVSGGRVEGGNVYSGREGSAGYVSGDRGTVARVGDNVYAGRDGEVYRRGEGGGWERNSPGSGWSGVSDRGSISTLDRQDSARSTGQQRVERSTSARPHSPARSGGGMSRGGGRRR